jgi:hypothetical protein
MCALIQKCCSAEALTVSVFIPNYEEKSKGEKSESEKAPGDRGHEGHRGLWLQVHAVLLF